MNTTLEARPTATANAEWVRARLARDGLTIRRDTISLDEAVGLLRRLDWPPEDIPSATSVLMRRPLSGTGWRMVLTGSCRFTLLTIART